jgi:hypothetical protein
MPHPDLCDVFRNLHNNLTTFQVLHPVLRYAFQAIERPRQAAVHGSDRIRIVAQIDDLDCAVPEGAGREESPQRGLERVNHVAGAADLLLGLLGPVQARLVGAQPTLEAGLLVAEVVHDLDQAVLVDPAQDVDQHARVEPARLAVERVRVRQLRALLGVLEGLGHVAPVHEPDGRDAHEAAVAAKDLALELRVDDGLALLVRVPVQRVHLRVQVKVFRPGGQGSARGVADVEAEPDAGQVAVRVPFDVVPDLVLRDEAWVVRRQRQREAECHGGVISPVAT